MKKIIVTFVFINMFAVCFNIFAQDGLQKNDILLKKQSRDEEQKKIQEALNSIRLEGVAYTKEGKKSAIINSKMFYEGERIKDFKIEKIEKESILLTKNNAIYEISLEFGASQEAPSTKKMSEQKSSHYRKAIDYHQSANYENALRHAQWALEQPLTQEEKKKMVSIIEICREKIPIVSKNEIEADNYNHNMKVGDEYKREGEKYKWKNDTWKAVYAYQNAMNCYNKALETANSKGAKSQMVERIIETERELVDLRRQLRRWN